MRKWGDRLTDSEVARVMGAQEAAAAPAEHQHQMCSLPASGPPALHAAWGPRPFLSCLLAPSFLGVTCTCSGASTSGPAARSPRPPASPAL